MHIQIYLIVGFMHPLNQLPCHWLLWWQIRLLSFNWLTKISQLLYRYWVVTLIILSWTRWNFLFSATWTSICARVGPCSRFCPFSNNTDFGVVVSWANLIKRLFIVKCCITNFWIYLSFKFLNRWFNFFESKFSRR